MNIFPLTCRRLYRVGLVYKSLIYLRLKGRVIPGINKIILIGALPVIPSLSTQNPSNDTSDSSVNTKNVISVEEKQDHVEEADKQDFPVDKTNPWDRVWAIYKKDEYGNYSKEMIAIFHTCYLASFIGFIFGGVQKSRYAYVDYMERNQATIFENPLDAKRKLQNHVSVHFGKGAFFWSWRMTLFTGGFMVLLTSFNAYRGSTRLIDYSASGAVTGALLRIKLGIPGIVIGGVVGGIMGLLCGMSTQTMLNIYGTSLDEVMAFHYELDRERKLPMEVAWKEQFEKSDQAPKDALEVLKVHEELGTKL